MAMMKGCEYSCDQDVYYTPSGKVTGLEMYIMEDRWKTQRQATTDRMKAQTAYDPYNHYPSDISPFIG